MMIIKTVYKSTNILRKNLSTSVVFGSGAVGLLYGSKLLTNQENKVHFIMRSDFVRARAHGVRVIGPTGEVKELNDKSIFHSDYKSILLSSDSNQIDWVICCLKSHALLCKTSHSHLNKCDDMMYDTKIRDMIAPLIGKNTKILVNNIITIFY